MPINNFLVSVNSLDLLQAFQILSLNHPSKTAGSFELWVSDGQLFTKRYISEEYKITIDIPCNGSLQCKIIGDWLSVPDLVKNLSFGETKISGTYNNNWIKFNEYNFHASIHPTNEKEIGSILQKIEIENSITPPSSIAELAARYERNTKLVDLIKKQRGSKCQICGFTFQSKNGEDYSEAHHLEHLSNGGLDASRNIIILCANHHREFHFGKVEIKNHNNQNVEFTLNDIAFKCNLQ